jgi:hypothetical protein
MTAPFTTRPAWQATPDELRHAVQRHLSSPITDIHNVHGGMSPGPAAVLSLDNDDRVFVKAVSHSVNATSYQLYQQEATALQVMPAEAPAAKLLAVTEIGDWIALVTTFIPGAVAGPPWTTPTITAVAQACTSLAAVATPAGLVPVIERLPDLDGWLRLAANPHCLTAWEAEHVERLIAATTGWPDWTSGQHLTHQDIRGDNAIIDPDGTRATLVDWGYCSIGARWLDRALLAADIAGAGHIDGPDSARRQALALLSDQPPEAARFVIVQAGMWRFYSTQPAHAGMPTHRAWQRARATALQPLIEDLLTLLTT